MKEYKILWADTTHGLQRMINENIKNYDWKISGEIVFCPYLDGNILFLQRMEKVKK